MNTWRCSARAQFLCQSSVGFSHESVSDSHRFSWRNTWNVTFRDRWCVKIQGKGEWQKKHKKMAKKHDHADHVPMCPSSNSFSRKASNQSENSSMVVTKGILQALFRSKPRGPLVVAQPPVAQNGPGGDCGSWVTKFVMLVDNVDRDFKQELWSSTWKELWDSHETYETCNHCTQHDSTFRVFTGRAQDAMVNFFNGGHRDLIRDIALNRVFHGFSWFFTCQAAWNGRLSFRLSDPKIPMADPQGATQHPSNKPWQMSGFRRALRSTGREGQRNPGEHKWGLSKTTASDCLPEEWNPDVDPWTAKAPPCNFDIPMLLRLA